jgi:parvulin-like peptidyl-prolyl isomerase
MRYRVAVVTGLLVVSMNAHAFLGGANQPLPLRNGRPVVASVNRDAISLDELIMQLDPPVDRARLRQGFARPRDLEVLDRLVNVKLIAQEAAAMGIDEAAEIRKEVEVQSRVILRDVLTERIVKDVKADPAAVEKLYRESVREWKTTSLLFREEPAARRAHMEIANGAAFADVAARAVAAKTATADGDDAFHPKQAYLPQVAEGIAGLKAGQLSPLVKIPAGFVALKVIDVRHPENPEARAEARRRVLDQQREAAMTAHEKALRRDNAAVNTAVLKSIDYEAAKPGIDALLKDKRVVAEIKGAAAVTVADLSDHLRLQFFHGADDAGSRKRMNERKEDALESTLARRLLNAEALRLGIEKSHAYRDRVNGYTETLVFGAFLQKVIVPECKMTEDEVKKYYDGHLKDFSSPEMMRIRSLAFTTRGAAEDAMRKLREGADSNWLAANAAGQAGKETLGLLTFDGRPVTVDSMPPGMRKAVAGAKPRDARLYPSPEGHVYVLMVQQVIAPAAKPYAEVREEIAKKLYDEKIKKSVDEYVRKLRAQSKVEMYLKRAQ